MSRLRSRVVLAGALCAASVAMIGGSIAVATAPPEDTSIGASESSAPESSGSAEVESSGGAEVGGVEILPPDESWEGVTRGEWDARWWQWALSMPVDVNPNFDPNGEGCGYGQFGPVFFLPGNFGGERVTTCVVAEGTAIYASPAGARCSTISPSPFFGRDEDELRACAAAALDEVEKYEATIVGQEIPLESYRTTSPLYTLTPTEDLFGGEPGVAQAVSEGYGFIIAPPPPGEYEITLSVTFVGEPQSVSTITLIVEAPQVIEPPSSEPGSTGPVEVPASPPETPPAPPETPPAPPETTETTVSDMSVATETTAA